MKTSRNPVRISVIFLAIILTSYGASSQIVTVELQTMQGFKHDASMTTHQANLNNELYDDGKLQINSRFVFDFNEMKVTVIGDSGSKIYRIFEKKRYTERNKTFNVSYFDSDQERNMNFVISEGVDPADGLVVYMRYNDVENGRNLVRGAFAANVAMK